MPLSDGTKAIATNAAWASAATADRTAPDDTSLTPPIVIADGWPASFSTGTNTPRRPVFNELEYRKDSSIKDIINFGILPWDTDVDTLAGGVKQVNGVIYRALVADTSPRVNPTTVGQTRWETVSGTLNVPDAPAAPTAVATNGELDWSWNCPKDNGAAVTSFDFQWRVSGQTAWTDVANLTHARYLLTGLTNGTDYEARVRATNTIGDSLYGSEGMGTPVAAVPGGGSTFALRADTGDASGEIDLDWLAPDDNGAPITQYRYQWKSGGQNYSGGRSGTSTSTSATVSSLNDGTEYDFRVRATNSVGNGPNSDEASATPETPFTPPTDTVPSAPTALAGTPRRPLIVDWTWEVPNDNGGQRIEDYDHQWRYSGDAWAAANLETTEGAYRRITVADTTNSVQARVRARNSVGVSAWSGTVTVASGDLLDAPTQRHRFTTSQTWNWPYDDLDRAVALLVGGRTVGSNALTIDLGTGSWSGGTSDGTTLWFVNQNSTTAVAYTGATAARNTGFDITLPNTGFRGGFSDGNIIWFIDDTNNEAVAYTAATRSRATARDFTLPTASLFGGPD